MLASRLMPFAVAGILAALIFVLPIRYVFLIAELAIAVLYATSLNLLMGYGGMLSLGHAAYYAVAAYTSGLLVVQLGWPMLPAMLIGPAGRGAVRACVRHFHRAHQPS